jgi:hypothetical protein
LEPNRYAPECPSRDTAKRVGPLCLPGKLWVNPRPGRCDYRGVPGAGTPGSRLMSGGLPAVDGRPSTASTSNSAACTCSDNTRRGSRAERSRWPRRRSKPLKGKAQGRFRCETEPEGSREEQDVKRLRKPEGVAQPGEVNPVWVASRYLMRRRAAKLQEGMLLVSGPSRIILRSEVQAHERT